MELVNRVVPPKPTDEEINAGKPKREAFRKQLLDTEKQLTSLQENISLPLGISSAHNALQKEVDTNLAWVNANIEVSQKQVDVKQIAFNETYQTLIQKYDAAATKAFEANPKPELVNQYPFPEGRKAMLDVVNNKSQETKRERQKKREQRQNRSYWDDARDALGTVLAWTLLVFVVAYGLRAASFAANQNLYLPLPYRALKFVYTFIFFPIWIPYYLYREIKHAIWPCIDEPRFESVFPVTPYNPEEGLDLNKRVFGYPNVPDLCAWIDKKRKEWITSQEKALCPDFTTKIMGEFEKAQEAKAAGESA